mmetsp:Transcript_27971/g.42653  ORF Transcript_27971/g.42653 Transcript_27971/m.42653 type:complete len:436 (+) Transcript_27971:202-1509(+)
MPSLSSFGSTIPIIRGDRQHRPFLVFLVISNALFVLLLNFSDTATIGRTLVNQSHLSNSDKHKETEEFQFRTNVAGLKQRHEGLLQNLHEQPSRLLKKSREQEFKDRKDRINQNLSLSKGRDEARKLLVDPFYQDWEKIYDFQETTHPVMYTFYEPAGSQIPSSQDLDALAVWKFAWTKMGWNPRVLNLSHAMLNKDYAWAVEQIDTILPADDEYNRYCFLRHFAMAAMTGGREGGGGWMSDYDTIPLNMQGDAYGRVLPNNGAFTSYELSTPSLIVGSGDEWSHIAKSLIEEGVNAKNEERGNGEEGGTDNFFFSDKMGFQKLLEQNLVISNERFVYNNPALPLVAGDGKACANLGKVLHFSHESVGTVSRAMVMLETMDQMTKNCQTFDFNVDRIEVGDTFYIATSPEMQQALDMGQISMLYRRRNRRTKAIK